MNIRSIFDKYSNTFTYIIHNKTDAIVIDPVLNFDPDHSQISYECIEEINALVFEEKLKLHACLETHVHADHLSGSYSLKEKYPSLKIAISENITQVQKTFAPKFNLQNFPCDGSQFDLLFKNDDLLTFGELQVKCLATPGHTPACTSFLIDQTLFSGDALFMPDFGTGRCDFPQGSAEDLYHSIHDTIYRLPDETIVYVGHDYGPGGREIANKTTIGACKKESKQLKDSTTKEEFVQFRTHRDEQLAEPKLLMQSLQVNIQAGKLPEKESNGQRYFKIPFST